MSIRIVGGRYRHRLIEAPENAATRPTKDMVRQGIFNALGPAVNGARVLDLFAGTGALGIEALSRGAQSCLFVDREPASYRLIGQNLASLGIPSEIWLSTAGNALKRLAQEQRCFDLIFLDPPYAMSLGEKDFKALCDDGILAEHGIIIYETEQPLVYDAAAYRQVREYRYGRTLVYILWRSL